MKSLAVIDGDQLVSAVIWILVLGVAFGLLWWLIDYCKVPEPFSRVAKVVVAIVAVVLLINALFSLAGHPFIRW